MSGSPDVHPRRRSDVRRALGRTGAATPEDARRTNRALLLRALHHGGPNSRAGLAKLVDLTPATVSAVVRDLIDDGLVAELGQSTVRSVGKPATVLDIRADGRLIVAIDLSPHDQVAGALVDLTGKIAEREVRIRDGRTGAAALDLVVEFAEELAGRADRPLLGIGVATPGFVTDRGHVTQATHLEWSDLDLVAAIADRVDTAVHATNDANAAATAELAYADLECDDLVVVRVDEGLGAGLVLDGRLHVGVTGGGGEFGHVVVDPDGPQCVCGRRGCLETYVASPMLAARFPQAPDDVVDAAGRALGAGLATLLSALDVDAVVVSGAADARGERFRDALHAAAADRVLPSLAERLRVRPSTFADDDALLGAAALVLDRELSIR